MIDELKQKNKAFEQWRKEEEEKIKQSDLAYKKQQADQLAKEKKNQTGS